MDKRLKISEHAYVKMGKKGITLPMLRTVLENGLEIKMKNGKYWYTLDRYVVVTDGENADINYTNIITIYELKERYSKGGYYARS